MQIKVKNINEYTRELDVDLSWEEVHSDFNKAAKMFSKKIKIPGFRPGKVPMERLLNQFQANIEAEFMDANFQKYYLNAVQQENLIPVNKAEIKDVDFRMMSTFLEFYTAAFKFIMFKLFHELGMRYPPQIDERLLDAGAHLTAIDLEKIDDKKNGNKNNKCCYSKGTFGIV